MGALGIAAKPHPELEDIVCIGLMGLDLQSVVQRRAAFTYTNILSVKKMDAGHEWQECSRSVAG